MAHSQVHPSEEEATTPSSPTSTGQTASGLPLPNTTPRQRSTLKDTPMSPNTREVFNEKGEPHLFPAMTPPKYSIFDVFPFSLLVKFLTKRGRRLEGRKAQKLRAILGRGEGGDVISHNVPLEITLYLVRLPTRYDYLPLLT